MDGAITLSQNATKIMWANVQLTPDPTIVSRETGTRHRTAERVSKQTDALVISISERREVVSLFAGGAKYILQEIPAVLARANQALATLDKYRARFDQVSMRLTALEFEGGVTLHDALTVLQRAEMVTRMAVEIERYIVELGAEGRLIEMQLEEMLVGVAADRSALVRDYLVDHSEESFTAVMEALPRLPNQDLLDFGRLGELMGYDRKLNTLDFPVTPRGYRILGPHSAPSREHRGERGARVRELRRDARPPPAASWRRSRASARCAPRRSGRACGGCRRSTWSTATSRPDQLPDEQSQNGRSTKGGNHSAGNASRERRPSVKRSRSIHITYKVGDKVVYPHHGAGKVLKKEQKEMLGETREYLTIKILHNDMTVMVPSDSAGRAGLRRVIGEDDVERVLAVLRDDMSQMPKNWNRRFKHNRDKMKTGDVFELAEVVRNLAIRDFEKGLSTGEKQMFTRAKKILSSELMYALDMEEKEAEEYLDDLLEETNTERTGAAK